MPYETLHLAREGNVVTVTLNRPQRLNAVNQMMRRELAALLEELRQDDEARVVVFTGAPRPDGRPCFCAGADLKERHEEGGSSPGFFGFDSWEEGLVRRLAAFGDGRDHPENVFNKVAAFPRPTIAAIDGVCTAGGLELAIACDLRIVAETAEINDLHMANLGGLGGGGLQTRLPRLVGLAKAKELLWTGEKIGGREACDLGLANRVFPSDQLLAGTMALAQRIAGMRPLGIRFSKLVLNAGASQSEYDSLRFSAFAETLLRTRNLEHVDEVYRAFTEKRSPATESRPAGDPETSR